MSAFDVQKATDDLALELATFAPELGQLSPERAKGFEALLERALTLAANAAYDRAALESDEDEFERLQESGARPTRQEDDSPRLSPLGVRIRQLKGVPMVTGPLDVAQLQAEHAVFRHALATIASPARHTEGVRTYARRVLETAKLPTPDWPETEALFRQQAQSIAVMRAPDIGIYDDEAKLTDHVFTLLRKAYQLGAEMETADLQATFDLRWKADMRAITRWQAEHPAKREHIWPDRTDLGVWLLGQLDICEAALMAVIAVVNLRTPEQTVDDVRFRRLVAALDVARPAMKHIQACYEQRSLPVELDVVMLDHLLAELTACKSVRT